MYATLRHLVHDEQGATLVEYGLLLMLIALVSIGVLTTIGSSVKSMYSNTANEL